MATAMADGTGVQRSQWFVHELWKTARPKATAGLRMPGKAEQRAKIAMPMKRAARPGGRPRTAFEGVFGDSPPATAER